MIKKKKLSRFFNKRWKAIACYLNNLCTGWDSETLHELRLQAKRVKALAELLKACSKHKKSYSIKELKDLFAHAGEIRMAQLNIETFTKYDIQNEGLKQEQKAIIQKESTVLCEEKKPYDKDIKKLQKRFAGRISSIRNKSILSYYKNSLEKVSTNFVPPINTNVWHDNRKIIKNLMYPLKVMPYTFVKQLNINEKYIDKLQEIIGQWHDSIITLDLLLKAGINDHPGYNLLNVEKQKLFESILQLTVDFDKKVIGDK